MKSAVTFSWFATLLGLSILFYSCSENTVTEDFELEMGLEYYPLEVGKYWVYEVDSTTFDIQGSGVDILESRTYVREEIIGITEDNEGDTVHIIERFEKKELADDWIIRDVWNTKVANNRAERTEENIRLIRMVFPLREGTDFNATLFVDENTSFIVAGESIETYKNWNAEVKTVGVQDTVGGMIFPFVATITYADDENLIEKRYAQSKYAENIGLIYREDWILDTQCLSDCDGQPWEEKAEKGYIIQQRLLEYN